MQGGSPLGKKAVVTIQPVGFEPAVERAAAELARYLPQLAPVEAYVLPAVAAAAGEATLVLGTSPRLAGLHLGKLPTQHALSDAFAIIPKGKQLAIAGTNPRSVLFGAYHLLEVMGARFLRPGPDGEVLRVSTKLAWPKEPIVQGASYRHRGICIEGSPRLDHVLDLLDWMAKRKMNTFQLQFRHAGVFWRRGYASPEVAEAVRDHKLSDADCALLDDRVIDKIRNLGMILHRVGHGWTSYAFGVPWDTWEKSEQGAALGKEGWVALVGGKRAVWRGVPINTELCYSKSDVQDAFVTEVMAYARKHPEVDALHVWLSDAYNNKCECAGCRSKSPSDWYALLAEAIGKCLKAEGLPMRVVFLGYVDLLWPPQEKRDWPDNVIFMYAPITRCYRHPLDDPKCSEGRDFVPFRLNQARLPRTNQEYAQVARLWKSLKLPDSFLFDYHLMWAVWRDGFGQDVGDVMAQDIRDLQKVGLDGLVSCQCTRAFYPMPYLPNVMADTLWDKGVSAEEYRSDLMTIAFGKHGAAVEAYFKEMIGAFQAGESYEHRSIESLDAGTAEALASKTANAAKDAKQRFLSAVAKEEGVVRQSLQLVALHAEQAEWLAAAILAGVKGKGSEVQALREAYEARLPEIMAEFHPWVDPLIARPVREAMDRAERACAAAKG
jgi:hypothetical protein